MDVVHNELVVLGLGSAEKLLNYLELGINARKPHCQGRVMDIVGVGGELPSQLPYPHHLLCTLL